MSLDFALETTGGTGPQTVSLSVEDHWSLVSLAQREGLTAFLTFQDYYEEHRIAWSSLEPISSDLARLENASGSDSRLQGIVAALRDLVSRAAERHINVLVLPD
jgi:hypothetical protein